MSPPPLPPPASPLPPFPPQPPSSPLPSTNSVPPASVTTRPSGSDSVVIPQSTSMTVTSSACNNIAQYPAAFISQYQQTTASAWNKANAKIPIQAGDVIVPDGGVVTKCAPSRHRLLLQSSSSITVTSSIYTPPGTLTSDATAALGSFQAAATTAYGSSQFASNYGVIAASTAVSPAVTQIYTAPPLSALPTVYAPPPPADASSTSGNSNALAIGVGVGVGGGVLAIAAVAAIIVVSKRNKQKVSAAE